MIKKYEGSHVRPGTQALASIVGLGVNANWLLVGQKPILRADLQPLGSLDPARLRLAIEAIEEGLLAAGQVAMPPAQKAETVLAAYDLLESEGVTKERVIKLVAAGFK